MCRNSVFSLWKLIIIVINYAISDHMRKWYSIFFPLLPPPPLFLTCLDCTLAPFNSNHDFVKKKKKVLLSSNFSLNWSLWELRRAHKAHAIAFQKSRVHQDHFLTSKSWPSLGWMPKSSITYLPFSHTVPQGTGHHWRQEIEQKKVLGLEVFQRFITWLNLRKFSQVW